MKTLLSLQGQSLGCHFFSFFLLLNSWIGPIAFISGGINSQPLDPKYNPDLDPL